MPSKMVFLEGPEARVVVVVAVKKVMASKVGGGFDGGQRGYI